jgi:hypothetical protein
MKVKKETKSKTTRPAEERAGEDEFGTLSSKGDLKQFLLSIRDKMEEGAAASIYAVTAMNHVMNLDSIYAWLDNDNKEIARDIWLRIKQSGLQVRNPSLLFSADELDKHGSAA